MEFLNQLSPFIENAGFPALIFAIWYIYHQSQVKTLETIINDNFEILKELLETNQYHAANIKCFIKRNQQAYFR
ncbi:MAG: hypothetical protein LUG16_02255 [Candidatus Gastranaerophilales bacterium]|nr:hypothetical protein [Candidatus Gastranaerophilales bacterium]